jgi:tRNA dimethylallyltransferase
MNLSPVLIAGPTASGKSDVAVALAELIGGEVVSVDSMQVYRRLDLGTAKPSREMQDRVRHHLIDVVELTDSFDAARFVRMAGEAVSAIQSRGRVPILCGGTGLYFNAWLGGLGDAPAPDPVLRAELEALPTAVLLDELARRDWQMFDEIDVDNRRRVVRAVEVIRLTGKPFSVQRAAWPERAPAVAGRSFGLERSRLELVRRIEERVERMFSEGLVEETRLLREGLANNRTAAQAIGYRQVMEHLSGERGLRETVEVVKARTRQYAKRQLTWFRQQLDLDWVQVETGTAGEVVARELRGRLQKEASPPCG